MRGGGCSLGLPGSSSELKVLLPVLEHMVRPGPLPSSWDGSSLFKVTPSLGQHTLHDLRLPFGHKDPAP